jgi:hypothetical protein
MFFYLMPYFRRPKPTLPRRPAFIYLASGTASIYLFFPYLREDPVNRFIEVFKSLSRYNWGGENLYFGQFVAANDLPWHYIPVWITITTPIFYLILFALGTLAIAKSLGRNIFSSFDFDKNYCFESLKNYIYFPTSVFESITQNAIKPYNIAYNCYKFANSTN